MPRNLEVKYKVGGVEKQHSIIKELPTIDLGVVLQTDTFFVTRHPATRMKLREPENQLIIYDRVNGAVSRPSDYSITQLGPEAVTGLKANLWQRGQVKKTRHLYLSSRGEVHTRIHLDQVHALGDFVEIEVVLKGRESVQDSHIQDEMNFWVQALQLDQEQICDQAYIDMA
jgi:adenylate cyclase class IV